MLTEVCNKKDQDKSVEIICSSNIYSTYRNYYKNHNMDRDIDIGRYVDIDIE